MYYFSLLLLFFLLPLLPALAHSAPPLQERIWYFAYLQNWVGLLFEGKRQWMVGHYRSLGIEEQFYLIWPLIVYKGTAKRILQIAIGAAIVSVLLRFALLAMHVDGLDIYRNTFTRMDALLIGAVCACLLRNPSCVEYLRRYAAWMWIAPLAAIEVMRGWYLAPAVQGLGYTVAALSFAVLLVGSVLTIGRRTILQRFLCSSFMRTFGKYSYGAYIWHLLVRTLVVKIEMSVLHAELPVLVNIPLMIAATLAFSMASYALVERPFLAFKGRFKPRFPARAKEEAIGLAASVD